LTLGVDRNSDKLSDLFDERDQAVKDSVSRLIEKAHEKDRHVGICGDAPSTHDDYAEFLVREGIDAISVSPDVVLETILKVHDIEQETGGNESTVSGSGAGYEQETSEIDEDSEPFELEVDVKTSIGGSAGEIYDALKDEGEAKANQLLNYTAEKVNSEKLHEGLGWLAKEGKIKMKKDEGDVKYSLK
jgi:hypothetical protein